MTKPLPYGGIKKQEKFSSLKEFNFIIELISYKDKTYHLFIVDMKFYEMNEKSFLFNEL